MSMKRTLIALDCDGTVDIAGGPVPLGLVRDLAARPEVFVFIIGNHALKNVTGLPLASDWLGLTLSGLEYPGGGKSRALKDWRTQLDDYERYVVVDDNPTQYLEGWDGWEFFLPADFVREFQ
jgi:hypothetical protein